MGSIFSCCVAPNASRQARNKKRKRSGQVAPLDKDLALESNPTHHPKVRTIFYSKYQAYEQDRKKSAPSNHVTPGQLTRKYSSCSTIFVDDSTPSEPSYTNMIQCVTLAVYSLIKYRDANRSLDIFDERLHPITRKKHTEDYFEKDPEQKSIYRFVSKIFNTSWFPPQCAVVTLVYVERLLSYTDIDLCPTNFRRVVLGAMLLACKFWKDQAVWNIDFCRIINGISLKDINELEWQYFNFLQFNLNVTGIIYVKYYFDLRSLIHESQFYVLLAPLTKKGALNLEALSTLCEDEHLWKAVMRRSSTDGDFTALGLSNAILS